MQSHTKHVFSDSYLLRWVHTEVRRKVIQSFNKLCLGVTRQIAHLKLNCAPYDTLECRYTHGQTQQSDSVRSVRRQLWENNQEPSMSLTWIQRRSLNMLFICLFSFWHKKSKSRIKVSEIEIFCFCELSLSEIIALEIKMTDSFQSELPHHIILSSQVWWAEEFVFIKFMNVIN